MREEEEPEPEPSMSEDDDATDLDLVRSNRTRASTDSPSSSSSSSSSSSCYPPDQVLENVLENVLRFLTCRTDRNAASLVCKSWKKAEAMSRTELFIGNCYSISPQMVINRFRSIKSVILKGKPRFADFNLVPPNWGAHFSPWISAMAPAYLGLEKLLLKRMSVTDHDLSLLAHSLPCFRELVLVCCEGFGTVGIAIIASKCRQLRVLDLIEDDVIEEDDEIDWLSCFPETTTCLESLSFDCLDSPVNFDALEGLVARSPLLKKLRVSRNVSIGQLQRLLLRAPQLTHLGTGSFNLDNNAQDQELDLTAAFTTCKSLSCLSGFKEILLDYLPSIYPVCCNLTSLNFSYANISSQDLQGVIVHCHKLQNLWVLDSVGDEGLQAVAATCKDLVELRVFPLDVREDGEGQVSEVGFVAISEGCRKLRSILYFCQHMTNAAVITMSRNCQELVVFRLCIMDRHRPDHVTGEPMDEGFGAIVMNCKKLTRLAISGLLTDNAFAYIGRYGKLVRTLSVAFAGNSDMALKYVLDGCSRLQKLEIRDSPFGDSGLLSGLHHYYNMRFLWMSSCRLTPGGCKELARRMPRLVVEVIRDGEDGQGDKDLVDKFYMYRSLAGPRDDTPQFVSIL